VFPLNFKDDLYRTIDSFRKIIPPFKKQLKIAQNDSEDFYISNER